MTSSKTLLALVLLGLLSCQMLWAQDQNAQDQSLKNPSVGVEATLKGVVIPGSELEVKPYSDKKWPLAVRIVAVYPHGTDFRYDIAYYGLEPGRYDLSQLFQRKDGSPLGDIPAMPVEIDSVLPKSAMRPHELEYRRVSKPFSYKEKVLGFAILWVFGLLAIVFVGRESKSPQELDTGPQRSLADRLRPLVSEALKGDISVHKQAELERVLVSYWTQKLGLEHETVAVALAKLRRDSTAGPLIRQLEEWLHRPGPKDKAQMDRILKQCAALEDVKPEGGAA